MNEYTVEADGGESTHMEWLHCPVGMGNSNLTKIDPASDDSGPWEVTTQVDGSSKKGCLFPLRSEGDDVNAPALQGIDIDVAVPEGDRRSVQIPLQATVGGNSRADISIVRWHMDGTCWLAPKRTIAIVHVAPNP